MPLLQKSTPDGCHTKMVVTRPKLPKELIHSYFLPKQLMYSYYRDRLIHLYCQITNLTYKELSFNVIHVAEGVGAMLDIC